MCPSDMALTLLSAHISGYNNETLVATKDMAPGQNSELNAKKTPINAGEFHRQTIYNDFVACFTTRGVTD